jgi:hypothetical protein
MKRSRFVFALPFVLCLFCLVVASTHAGAIQQKAPREEKPTRSSLEGHPLVQALTKDQKLFKETCLSTGGTYAEWRNPSGTFVQRCTYRCNDSWIQATASQYRIKVVGHIESGDWGCLGNK